MRKLSYLLGILFLSSAMYGQVTFYLDPDAGGSLAGTQANPWTTINWPSVNLNLAANDVTIYFSASNAAHNANQTGPAISISRSNTSSHVLTLDGISFYNNNDASPPATWPANFTPVPCVYGVGTCAWGTAFKYQITNNTSPITSNNDTGGSCRTGVNLTGFKTVQSAGGPSSQGFDWVYMENTVVQFMDISAASTTSGPGAYIGPGNHGPGSACGHSGAPNVTFQYNYVHATYGECVYVGASSSDPVGTPFATATGDNYLLQGNRLEDCARWGGQGEGFDIKDGHTNLRVINNIVRPNLSGLAPAPDGQGIEFESATLIDGNYIERPEHNGITVASAWCNSTGRGTVDVRNNIVVNTTGSGHRNGIEIFDTTCNNTHNWQAAHFYNNAIFNTADACINIVASGNNLNMGTAENNICHTTTGGITGGTRFVTVDYNNIFNGGAASGSHSISTDPKFVSTSIPYIATNFQLQAGSGAAASGLNLGASFTNDYANNVRTVPWSMGAYIASGGTPGVSLSPTSLAFGSITVGMTSPQQAVTLTNSGSVVLNFTSVALTGSNPGSYSITSNGCIAPLPAGNNCVVQVTFHPAAPGSFNSAGLVFTTDAPSSPDTVTLTGTGVAAAPAVSLSPTSISTWPSSATQTVNTTSSGVVITLTNTGTATLNITTIAKGGTDPTQFSIVSTTCGSTLAASFNCLVTVAFAPTTAGAKTASIIYTTNAASTPDTVVLSGTGTATSPAAVCAACFAQLKVPTIFTCTKVAAGLAGLNFDNCNCTCK